MIASVQARSESKAQELRRIQDWARQNSAESRTIKFNYVCLSAGKEMLELRHLLKTTKGGAFKMELGVADSISDDAPIFLGRLSQGDHVFGS